MDAACISPLELTDCFNCRDLCLGPVIFPCGHLICRKCVRQLIVREGLPAHCSSCHQIIPLVQGETISDIIDNMCKDFVIEKMIFERLRQDRETSCDLCHETKVTHVCLDCRHYLCNTCSSDHSVRERSYGHKQQTLTATWTTTEIQTQGDSSDLEALCRSIQCCQTTDKIAVDTQTTRSEVEKILYDQICQLKNSKKDVDKLITSLQNVKVRLTIKQQILDMYAAELAKHDQSLVQIEPFLNRVRQIKEDNIPPFPHLAALEGCIRALGHCGYMTSERPNTPQVNGDEAREVVVVEQMVEITLNKTESENQVTSQTNDKSPLTFKGVGCIKTASRCTPVKTDVGTVLLETIPDSKVIMQSAKTIVVAKVDWSNDRIQKRESQRREMISFEEKNKTEMMRLEKDIVRVSRQLEDERRRWTHEIEEERSTAKDQVAEIEARMRNLEGKMNRVIKQLEEERSRLEEKRNLLKSQLNEERRRRQADHKVMNAKLKEEMKKEKNKMKAFEEKNKAKVMQVEKDIIRVTKQLEDERRRWAQLIEEERKRATEQLENREIRFTQQQEENKKLVNQLDDVRSRLTLELEEERSRLTLLLEEERKRKEADLKVMNAKHREETKQERKNVIRFVMRLEGRHGFLSSVLGRVEDGHLSQVVRQLLQDFHIRLLGVDCGLNFLMEVPTSLWGEIVQEQLQVVLGDLVPETDRQEVTWSRVTQLESLHDSELRLGGTMLAPETATYQDLCQCLGVQSVDDAVKLCLLSDQLSDKQMSSETNLWWQHVVRASGAQPLMTSELYEQLLARFSGPATTVEVHSVTDPRLNIRTLGEAIFETGERRARLVLFPQQVDILNRSPPGAFLSGPPGTGKTIVLIMQGLTWLYRGHDVHVVSTWNGSCAVTTIIEHQLQETAKTSTDKQRVHRHQFNVWKNGEVEAAVKRLNSLSEGRQLCVIADEVVWDYRKSFTEFSNQLIVQVPGVFIWGASVYHDIRPSCLDDVKLTTPLRSPPVVVREVMESWDIKNKRVREYTDIDVPVPTDGPPVMRIKHRDGQSGHTGVLQHDCVECGHQVARVLTELDVGRKGDSNGPPPLQYRDVLVLCFDYPIDDQVDSNCQVATTASGLVQGLRDSHVPVRVVKKGDEAAIRDTALGVGDLVTVANWLDVRGLERKVVVVETEIGGIDRLLAMSRCTSQLVLIDCWPV